MLYHNNPHGDSKAGEGRTKGEFAFPPSNIFMTEWGKVLMQIMHLLFPPSFPGNSRKSLAILRTSCMSTAYQIFPCSCLTCTLYQVLVSTNLVISQIIAHPTCISNDATCAILNSTITTGTQLLLVLYTLCTKIMTDLLPVSILDTSTLFTESLSSLVTNDSTSSATHYFITSKGIGSKSFSANTDHPLLLTLTHVV